jgi:hypothetical protein
VAARLPPAEAAHLLAEALSQETYGDARRRLLAGLSAVSGRLPPTEAAHLLAGALAKETCAYDCGPLAEALSAVSGRLPPAEATAVCRSAARLLADALAKEWSDYKRCLLAEGLSVVSGRLPPAEAAAVCGSAARLLAEAHTKETSAAFNQRLPLDLPTRYFLARGLSSVSGQLPPAEAARLLAEALAKETDADTCKVLAEGLVTITDGMERAEADRICEQALLLVEQREVSAATWRARMAIQVAASLLVQQLAEEKGRSRALQQVRQTAAAPDVNRRGALGSVLPQVDILDRLLSEGTPPHRPRGAVATTTAVGLACGGPLPALAAWPSAAEPLPCRMTTPELVELLKYPTCIGPARQVVLKHLGNRYGRTFANHWEFVRFAKEQNLGLDFTTPPKRPRANVPLGTP